MLEDIEYLCCLSDEKLAKDGAFDLEVEPNDEEGYNDFDLMEDTLVLEDLLNHLRSVGITVSVFGNDLIVSKGNTKISKRLK